MLDMLDAVIGFVLVMLVMSMAVTMLTQLVGTALFNLQGRSLKIGISHLISLLDRGIKLPDAEKIADHILRNPLVGKPTLSGNGTRLASVVHREELFKLVLDFAIPGDLENINEASLNDEDKLRLKLRKSLAANGIPDPQAVLKQIRDAAIELEKSNPELSHSARIGIAILNFAASEYLSKLNSWFDQTMDRVSGIFTAHTRVVTLAVSLLLAFFVQLDSIDLINRLSVDDDLRAHLVASAVDTVEKREAERAASAPAQPPAGTATAAPAAALPAPAEEASMANDSAPAGETAAADTNRTEPVPLPSSTPSATPDTPQEVVAELKNSGLGDLEELGIIGFPHSGSDWLNRWKVPVDRAAAGSAPAAEPAYRVEPYRLVMHLFGILLSAALLSLGAPVWYSVLRDLVKLRSVVARKDDEQRAERQSSQVPAAGTAGAALLPPEFRGGEAGDLTATG